MTTTFNPETIEYIREKLGATEEDSAHIVRVGPNEDAAAVVLKARIKGRRVTALCGYSWVPSKNPENLPLCGKCRDIYDLHRALNEKPLDETPVV